MTYTNADVKRLNVPDPVSDFTIPDGICCAIIKNVGANDMRFNFDGDFETHYFTIGVGKSSPKLNVNPDRKFYTDGIGGATTIEVLLWG